MKGTIGFDPRMKCHYVTWYHGGRTRKIYHYKGRKLRIYEMAEQLLSDMRSDQQHGVFRIENFLRSKRSKTKAGDAIDEWLENTVKNRTPSTQQSYSSLLSKHIKPFFDSRKIVMDQIDYELLMELLSSLDLSVPSKRTLFKVLKSFMRYAKKAKFIENVPDFPGQEEFNVEGKPIQWLPEERQIHVIKAVPMAHQPIFWFLKYHLCRPAEACALRKKDFDGNIFNIQRSLLRPTLSNKTKYKNIKYIPIVEVYRPVFEWYRRQKYQLSSPFIFVNPESKSHDKYYTVECLRAQWKTACKFVDEDISFYKGIKHSSANQLIKEYEMSKNDVRIAMACAAEVLQY